MIKKILKYYAICDCCGKPFKINRIRAEGDKKDLVKKMSERDWVIFEDLGVVCASCAKKYISRMS